MMQNVWGSYGLPSGNLVWTEAFIPYSVWVTLPDTANTVKRVTLPEGTSAVCLWTQQDMVWYAINADPGPIPPPVTQAPVPATAFVLGGVAMPGQWHQFAVPEPPLTNALHLISTVDNALVLLMALREQQ